MLKSLHRNSNKLNIKCQSMTRIQCKQKSTHRNMHCFNDRLRFYYTVFNDTLSIPCIVFKIYKADQILF